MYDAFGATINTEHRTGGVKHGFKKPNTPKSNSAIQKECKSLFFLIFLMIYLE